METIYSYIKSFEESNEGVLYTSFFYACSRGYIKTCRILILICGVDVNHARTGDGTTPLYFASQSGYKEVCQVLIKSGANVNQVRTLDGETPLWIASFRGHKEVCQLLISSGSNVNQATTNDGFTPLWISSYKGHKEVCQLLISSGANVNQVTIYDGTTPLWIASQKGHKEICQLLIYSGATLSKSCVDIVLEKNDLEFYQFLCEERDRRNKLILFDLLVQRSLSPGSVFYKDFLPLDVFKMILKECEIPFVISHLDNERSNLKKVKFEKQ